MNPVCFRICTERHGDAWCPKYQISKDVIEWLEVDLGNLTVVTHVETQGRFGNGQVCTKHTSRLYVHKYFLRKGINFKFSLVIIYRLII